MTPILDYSGARLYNVDCMDLLRSMPDASVDSVVCDPPYGLGFMGRKWDAMPPGVEWARELLRVLKPGGHAVAFGSTRTVHRLAVALEDGGLEIRDTIHWLYYSGFPKSKDAGAAIDEHAFGVWLDENPERRAAYRAEIAGKRGNAKREIDRAYQAEAGTLREVTGVSQWAHVRGAERQSGYGFGGGVEATVTAPATPAAVKWAGFGTALKPSIEPAVLARKPLDGTVANTVLTYGTGALNIDACRIADGDPAWPGPSDEKSARAKHASVVGCDSNRSVATYGEWGGKRTDGFNALGRFPANTRYCPKAGRKERERGCFGLPLVSGNDAVDRKEGSDGVQNPRAGAGRTSKGVQNYHPTVKPVALMRWLCRLVTPPGGVILDPFAGSGAAGIAAALEGFEYIGAELYPLADRPIDIKHNPDYCSIAASRILHATMYPDEWTIDAVKRNG